MDDLLEFLATRLDEDEQIANAVEDNSAPWNGVWRADGNEALRTYNGHVLTYVREHGRSFKPGLVNHWVRHDPAHVLAEVGAKRRILAFYVATKKINDDSGAAIETAATANEVPSKDVLRNWSQTRTELTVLEGPIRCLALPYADHPDYRTEWAPDPADLT